MKKVLILACAALTACTNDIDLGTNKEQVETLSNAIGFQMAKKNMTTTKATQTLQSQGHYNFGVWGYKAVTGAAVPTIMENYLVGYYDATKGYGTQTGTTFGDGSNSLDGKSYWMYEGMGKDEYTGNYAGAAITDAYKSNIEKQYLRYWDLSSARTTFYAYAPYVNSTSAPVKFFNSTSGDLTKKTMSFPEGSIVMGKDKPADQEFMYAVTKVEKSNYKEDVKLEFHRMGARIQIKFWEDIPGYTVKMKNLSTNSVTSPSTLTEGIYAKPAIAPTTPGGNRYTEGKYLTKTGADIVFNNDEATATKPTATVTFKGVTNIAQSCLTFDIPTEQLGENRNAAKHSATKYYMIPRGATFDPAIADDDDFKKTGFIFHVSYELKNNQTDETITVTDAKVFVPADQCNWESNKSYTYVFKITKNSNGTTDKKDPKPEDDLIVDTDNALYPIVFDGCTVVDYDEVEVPDSSDGFVITDGTFNYYLTLSASTLSKAAGATPITANAYKTNGTTDTSFATTSELKIYDNTGAESSDFDITYGSGTATTTAPKIAAKTTANSGETYTLKYTSGTKELTATFTVTD